MAFMEITLLPIGTNTTSCSPYIAKVLDVIDTYPTISYELNPMGTTLEGELGELFQCVQEMQETIFNTGVERVYTVIKIDDRRDRYQSMSERVQSVKEKKHDK